MDPARLTIGLHFGPIEVECLSPDRKRRDEAREMRKKVAAVLESVSTGEVEITEEDGMAYHEQLEDMVIEQVHQVKRDGKTLHEGDAAKGWVKDQDFFFNWEDLWRAFLEVFFHRWLAAPREGTGGSGGH